MDQYFAAPWSPMLKVSTAVFLAVALLMFLSVGAVAGSVLVGVLIVAFAFSVRGYRVGGGRLLVLHPGWRTHIELSRLVDVYEDPRGASGSLRLGGIGGAFSFVGLFWSSLLGPYRAYATDATRAVILDFGTEKVLVTPEAPEEFVKAIRLHRYFKE